MSQPPIRSAQLDSSDFSTIVESSLGAAVEVSNLKVSETLVYSGSPLAWRNMLTSTGVGVGDGLNTTGGSPVGSQVLSVDSTVARTDITTETFTFAGAVSLNLNDTSQAADEDIWRVGVSGSQFLINTRTDADGAGNNAIVIDRTGTVVDSVTFPRPIIATRTGTGTSTAIQIQAAIPTLLWNDTDATANEGIWDIVSASASSSLDFRTRTDAHGSGANWLSVVRSGTTVTSIDFTGTTMTLNGLPVVFGSPSGGGIGDALLAGSPITTINNDSFAVNQALRVIGSPTTNLADIEFATDGSGFKNLTIDGKFSGPQFVQIEGFNTGLKLGDDNAQMMFGAENDAYISWGDATEHWNFNHVLTGGGGHTSFLSQGVAHLTMEWFGSPGTISINNGHGLRIQDTTDSDHAYFKHNGTDFVTEFVNTGSWNIDGLGGSPSTGGINVDGRGLLQGAPDSGGAGKQILRSIRFVVGAGSVAGTNLDIQLVNQTDGSYNIPSVAVANDMPVDTRDGDWELDASGVILSLHMDENVIGIVSTEVTLAIWNGASTTVQYYITTAIDQGAGSPSVNHIEFTAFPQGSNVAASWPGTVTNTINDQVRIQLTYVTSN